MNQTESTKASSGGGSKIRLGLLVVVLLVICGVTAFQLRSAAKYQQAMTDILETRGNSVVALEGGLQPEKVREVLGFKPAEKDYDNGIHTEIYKYFTINPKEKNLIVVAYVKNKEDKFVCTEVFFEEPTAKQIEDLTTSEEPEASTELPGLESLVKELDTDKDGKISMAELDESPFAVRFKEADTDEDGFITLEELRARADRLRVTGTPEKTWKTEPYDPRTDDAEIGAED